jgi:poly(A) polymerase
MAIDTISIMWTDHMQHALAELQQRPLLQRLLVFAEQCSVELYAVGGTLRDLCLGRPVHDVDVVVMGDVLEFARGFANHLRAAYVPMDAERGEVRVVYRKRDILDFARMRGGTIITDLQCRDFTINAMACPLAVLLTHAAPGLIDPHGGWDDLRARTIRMVSPTSFRDDPLRLLRSFRLAATLDLTIDPPTLAAVEPVAPLLIDVAVERIHGELFRLFAASQSSPHIATMARLGLLGVLFPELAAAQGIPCQPGEQLDVLDHSVRTYQAVEELIGNPGSHLQPIAGAVVEYFRTEECQALVKWAALLHATWKAAVCQGVSLEHVTALPYAKEQAQQWEQIGSRLKLSRKQIDYVKTLIVHYAPTFQLASLEAQGRLTLRSVHRWCKEVEDSMLAVFVLAIGHALARGERYQSEPGVTILAQLAPRVWDIYRHRILPVVAATRLVTGHDLQQVFHLTPSPRFKALLDELEVAQVEGHIRTRTEALQWVAAQLGNQFSR